MARRPVAFLVACGLTSLALIVAGMVPSELAAANKTAKPAKPAKKPIRNPKFDPTAEQVDLFDAVDAKQVEIKLIPKDAMSGTVFVENKTDKPLTVKVPEAMVGVSIHSQFGGGGMMGGGMGGMGGGMGGMGGGMGGGQAMGGGMGGGMGGMGGGGMGGMGGGMFSIPAESVVSVAFNSVCLEHGKQEPNPRSRYTLIPVAKFNSDPVLYQLLRSVSTGKVDQQSAQAAAWHVSSKMSFEELAMKPESTLGNITGATYFSAEQLYEAKSLVSLAAGRAQEQLAEDAEQPAEKTPPSRVSRVDSN